MLFWKIILLLLDNDIIIYIIALLVICVYNGTVCFSMDYQNLKC